MNKIKILLISILSSLWLSIYSQQVDLWFDLFATNRLISIDYNNDKIFAASKNTLLIYDISSQQLDRLSAMNQLSDHSIVKIKFFPKFNLLAIIYETGKIDFWKDGQITSIPYIYQNPAIFDKTLNDLEADNNFIYIAANYGIFKINPQNLSIEEVVRLKDDLGSYLPIKDLCVFNDTIYAVANNYYFKLPPDQLFNLSESWQKIPANNIQQIETDQNILIASYYSDNQFTIVNLLNNKQILQTSENYKFTIVNGKIYLYGAKVHIYDTSGNWLVVYSPTNYGIFYINDLKIWQNKMLLADYYNGINIDFQQKIKYNAPFSDNVYDVKTLDNYIYILHKTDNIDNSLGITAALSIYDGQNWNYFTTDKVSDFTAIAVDNSDPTHLFLGTNGSGLVEIQNFKIKNIYNQTNAPFDPIETNKIIISDLKFDKNKNLWIFYQSKSYPLIKLNSDASWEVVELSAPAAGKTTGKFIFTSQNFLYGVLFESGVLAIDLTNQISKAFYPQPQIGKTLFNVVEDKDGIIWLATYDGIGYLTTQDFNSPDFKAIRPKVEVTLNDTTIYAYLFDNVRVFDIKVDPANRKWVATLTGGAYLLSEDCLEQIAYFNRHIDNFPVNDVYKISIDYKNGVIYFVTDIGVLAYKSDASAPKDDFAQVKIYPNPVRPDYDGNIIIEGLMFKTLIKIVDLQGNLVYEMRSNAGTAVWNGKNLNGIPVKSGVYFVICSDEQGVNKCVKKLVIIR